jgi:hypothetical protein
MISSRETSSPGRSSSTLRMSSAREPIATGTKSPCGSRRQSPVPDRSKRKPSNRKTSLMGVPPSLSGERGRIFSQKFRSIRDVLFRIHRGPPRSRICSPHGRREKSNGVCPATEEERPHEEIVLGWRHRSFSLPTRFGGRGRGKVHRRKRPRCRHGIGVLPQCARRVRQQLNFSPGQLLRTDIVAEFLLMKLYL